MENTRAQLRAERRAVSSSAPPSGTATCSFPPCRQRTILHTPSYTFVSRAKTDQALADLDKAQSEATRLRRSRDAAEAVAAVQKRRAEEAWEMLLRAEVGPPPSFQFPIHSHNSLQARPCILRVDRLRQ